MRKLILSVMLLFASAASVMNAGEYNATEGKWQFKYTDTDNRLAISYNNKTILDEAYASVTCNVKGSTGDVTVTSGGTVKPNIVKTNVTDCFGTGRSYEFRYRSNGIVMTQKLNFYDNVPYMIAQVTVTSDNGDVLESRRMIPLASDAKNSFLNGSANRVLWVPFDNDAHGKYGNYELGNEITSHEVTCAFDASSRFGFVAGSVDHDKWKSGITIKGENKASITKLELLSGYTDSDTRDVLPHGKVFGTEVASARYMIGVFDDWREGMNTYGDANNCVAPRLEWTKGNPIGWSSWGVMQEYVNYNGVVDVSNFLKQNLYDLGFHNNEGKTSLSLDAFATDNISLGNIQKLATKVCGEGEYKDFTVTKQGNNQNVGLYCGPFVAWSWALDSDVEGTGLNGQPKYKTRDMALKVNGEVYALSSNGGSGCAIDPTHPGVKAMMEYFMSRWASCGIKYIKADFMNCGMVEGDSWYDPNVTTGTEAYNYGMKILRDLAKKYDMYVVLSIAPLFPYEYAHGRRTCCDRFSEIGESEYVMNAISYGWWTDKLYTVNDPDQLVMCKEGNNMKETLGENRARATTGMATGAFIFGDNFSDQVQNTKKGGVAGYPEESRTRALSIMGNADINDYVRNNTGSFMPIEGNQPSASQSAESLFMRETEDYVYVAVFNYKSLFTSRGNINFDRIGLSPSDVEGVKELWLDGSVSYDDTKFSYEVPAKDVRVYRFTKKHTGIGLNMTDKTSGLKLVATVGSDRVCKISANEKIMNVRVCGMMGELLASVNGINAEKSDFLLPSSPIYILQCEFQNGELLVQKCVPGKL